MPRRRLGTVALAVVCAVMVHTLATEAEAPSVLISDAAVAVVPASFVTSLGDAVSVFQTGELTAPIRDAALTAAAEAGAPAVIGRGFSAGLTAVRRGATIIQRSSGPGWGYPMAMTALPLEALGGIVGRAVAECLHREPFSPPRCRGIVRELACPGA